MVDGKHPHDLCWQLQLGNRWRLLQKDPESVVTDLTLKGGKLLRVASELVTAPRQLEDRGPLTDKETFHHRRMMNQYCRRFFMQNHDHQVVLFFVEGLMAQTCSFRVHVHVIPQKSWFFKHITCLWGVSGKLQGFWVFLHRKSTFGGIFAPKHTFLAILATILSENAEKRAILAKNAFPKGEILQWGLLLKSQLTGDYFGP